MRKMSKILSGVCALAMVSCMATTAFAAESPDQGTGSLTDVTSNNTQEVNVQVKANKPEADTVYSVQINWDEMKFEWNAEGSKPSWNPLDHKTTDITADWNKETANITVQNHSNAVVYCKGTIAAGTENYTEEKDGVTLSLSAGNTSMEMAKDTEGGHNSGADKTITVKVAGTPDKEIAEVIGAKVTVTISSTDLG